MFKKIISFTLAITLLCACALSANAYVLIGKKLSGGVGNSGNNTRYYWLSNGSQKYTSTINAAMYSWNHTASTPGVTTKIWFQPVSSKTNSVMDIYIASNSEGAFGKTVFLEQLMTILQKSTLLLKIGNGVKFIYIQTIFPEVI